MAFCKNCGAPVEGAFCAKCGTPATTPAAPAYTAPPAGQAYGQAAPIPATTGMSENVAGALCYILGLITGILFLVLAPYNQSKFVRFHAFQSIFFNVGWVAIWIVYTIIEGILMRAFWGMGVVFGLIGLVIWLGGLIVWIVLMVKAYGNQKWMLPIIGPIADKQA